MPLKKFKYLIVGYLIAVTLNSSAQIKRSIYSFGLQAFTSEGKSLFKGGSGVAVSALWPLSPSFNIGPAVAYQSLGVKGVSDNFNPLSLSFAADYFPEALLKKITNKEKVLPGIYIQGQLGHQFANTIYTNNEGINIINVGVGYLLPVGKNAIHFQAGIVNYVIPDSYTSAQQSATTFSFGIGYSWLNKK